MILFGPNSESSSFNINASQNLTGTSVPSSPPDFISVEPEDIGDYVYGAVPINHRIFLPLISR